MAEDDRARCVEKLRADLALLQVVELAPSLVARTHDLLARRSLRAGDAIHLAAAIFLREATGVPVELVGFDERLNAAARLEGFTVRP